MAFLSKHFSGELDLRSTPDKKNMHKKFIVNVTKIFQF